MSWSKDIRSDKSTSKTPPKPDEVVPSPCSPRVIVYLLQHSKTDHKFTSSDKKKLAAIRLNTKSKERETASNVAEDLQRRYDSLFLRSETLKLVRLAAVRWSISHLEIHTYT
jgi:hypothetical protein